MQKIKTATTVNMMELVLPSVNFINKTLRHETAGQIMKHCGSWAISSTFNQVFNIFLNLFVFNFSQLFSNLNNEMP